MQNYFAVTYLVAGIVGSMIVEASDRCAAAAEIRSTCENDDDRISILAVKQVAEPVIRMAYG